MDSRYFPTNSGKLYLLMKLTQEQHEKDKRIISYKVFSTGLKCYSADDDLNDFRYRVPVSATKVSYSHSHSH